MWRSGCSLALRKHHRAPARSSMLWAPQSSPPRRGTTLAFAIPHRGIGLGTWAGDGAWGAGWSKQSRTHALAAGRRAAAIPDSQIEFRRPCSLILPTVICTCSLRRSEPSHEVEPTSSAHLSVSLRRPTSATRRFPHQTSRQVVHAKGLSCGVPFGLQSFAALTA